MIRTLIFAGLAAFAGKKLYESGAIDEFVADAKSRLNLDRDTGRASAATSSPNGLHQPAAPVV